MSVYELITHRVHVIPETVDLTDGLLNWLAKTAPAGADWLLAHCYDGVVWGWRADGGWALSSQVAPEISPELSDRNVLQARVFGESGELLLWREGTSFQARKVVLGAADAPPYDGYMEDQWLWGTREDKHSDADKHQVIKQAGFTLLADGAQGLRHAVPMLVTDEHFTPQMDNYRPVRLRVEHYLERDKTTGLARVWLSRLVKIYSEAWKETPNG